MAKWNENPFAWLGATAGVAIAIPAGIALAPLAMGSLGVFGGAAALTALGAGVIAIISVTGKHIDEAMEANNSHDTIKKILDSTEAGYTDAKKIEDIKRIAKAKTDNKFLKSFNIGGNSSEKIGDMYLGALDGKDTEGKKYEDEKIIAGLKAVNRLDQLKSTNDEEFIRKLNEFKENINLKSTYQVGQKITEHSDKFFDGVALKEDTNNVQNFFDLLGTAIGAARPAGPAATPPAALAAAAAAPAAPAAAAAAAAAALAADGPGDAAAATAAAAVRPAAAAAPARPGSAAAAGAAGGADAATAPHRLADTETMLRV